MIKDNPTQITEPLIFLRLEKYEVKKETTLKPNK